MPKKVLIALPPLMLTEVDDIAVREHRTRSDLIREALRKYIERAKERQARTIGLTQFGQPLVQESIDV